MDLQSTRWNKPDKDESWKAVAQVAGATKIPVGRALRNIAGRDVSPPAVEKGRGGGGGQSSVNRRHERKLRALERASEMAR